MAQETFHSRGDAMQGRVLRGFKQIGDFLQVGQDYVGVLIKRYPDFPICLWGQHRLTTSTALLAWLTEKARERGNG
jgi:hypothetical protein